MTRIYFTLLVTLIVFFIMTSICVSQKIIEVIIDPGHGGPNASKYGNNGGGYNEGRGSSGPDSLLTEQWVNLQVSFLLKDSIDTYCLDTGYVRMTRTIQTDDISLWQRANLANTANGDWPANAFISVHHNGLPLDVQGTEVWWSSIWTTDSSHGEKWRDYDDSVLARKINSRLVYRFGYSDRCGYPREENPSDSCTYCCNDYCHRDDAGFLWCPYRAKIVYVLRNTICPAALSEASNLYDHTEELLFLDTTKAHIKKESRATFEGWKSYYEKKGIAIVRNSYEGGGGEEVIIGDYSLTEHCENSKYYHSPYIVCWLAGENHCLEAKPSIYINPYTYTFHHWKHLLSDGSQIGEDWYYPVWNIVVGSETEYHKYVAYFTGGPYRTKLNSPNGGEVWGIGENRSIVWDAITSYGADSTTVVDVYLDRHNGSTGYPEKIYSDLPRKYFLSYLWTVTGPNSDSCKIKVVAHDIAGNEVSDVSDNLFSIKSMSITILYPNGGEIFCGNTSQIILWSSQNFTGNVKIEYSTNGGTNWSLIVASTINNGSQTWTVPNISSDSCRIKISDATDGNPTDMSDTNFSINTIPAPPSNLTWDHCGLTGDINLYWQDNSNNETHFNVYRNGAFLHSTSHSPYTDYYLIPGQSYTYQVNAANGDCESGPSDQVVAVPDSSPVITQGPDLGSNCIIDGNTYTVTVTAHDPGGSPLTYHWECSDGYFSNGLQSIVTSTNWTTYTASLTYSSALAKNLNSTLKPDCYVKVTVKDNGCDYVFKRKSFAIVQDESECCSSCPYLFSWDGYEFVKGNNLLAKSEDSSFFKCNIWDIYHLHQPLISESDFYPLRIEEFENEHSFIDYLGLVSIDYPADRKFGVASDGKFYFYSNPCLPLSCIDNLGQDCLAKIIQEDTIYFESKNKGYLILNFGSLKTAQGLGKAMVEGGGGGTVPDPPKEPCNYTKPVPVSVKSQGNILTVEVFSDNNWIPVTKVYPRARPGKTLVEFSPYIKSGQELKVKLSWEKRYKANQLAYYDFDTTGFVIDRIPLSSAHHSIEGEVTSKLTSDDNNFAELKPGEWIDLFFPYKPLSPDKRRGFALIAKGYYLSQDIEFSSSGNIVSTPEDFSVSQNYPNPFNPQTEIKFSLPQNSKVKLEIFNVLRQKVKTLIDQDMPAGNHIVVWDGKNDCGEEVASGIYFYWIKAGSFTKSAKMSLLK